MADRVPHPFLIGVYGIEVTEDMLRMLRESNAAGIYLLRRNIESTEQVRAFVSRLEEELEYRLLVAVDHEGGRVYRFTRGITFFPGNLALGRAATPAFAYEVGRAMGRELGGMGININLAPVLDLAGEEMNPELTLRSFGSDPSQAATMGAEMIRGFREVGISATARTFPGKGAVPAKMSGTPAVKASRESLHERELVPFKAAIAGHVPIVMTANALYPALDSEQPAMFSPLIVTDLLRRDLSFNGVAMTEDLTAPGALGNTSIEEGVVRAIRAGNDLCLLGHDYENVKRASKGLKAAIEGGRVATSLIEKSQKRLQSLLVKKAQIRPLAVDDPEEAGVAAALAGIVAGGAVKVERDPQEILPIPYGKRTGLLVPRLLDLADRYAIDDELRGAAGLIQSWVLAHSTTVEVLEVPIQPAGDMLSLTLDWAAGLETVVVLCFDAHRFPGQRKVLAEVQRRCPKVVAVLLANPWDREFVNEKNTLVNTFGFRVCQLSAAVSVLFGKGAPKG